ncbi:ABC transporter substrate-binding protein [Streptomyces albipurpureus]|uniref:ABC transporter substrate-binding protein n=1 Tax=Streptomyces albipurpureus TaxID=2897419 RepID=A0ABT0UY98_9ACTN|nr:ABC transporter substrate-binding protein [Streptomyces sp. CWNU-1]MCM2393553.1 ABC transporter substrate-binding protein [Streptomyces sp. CWNU-1]
MKTKILSLFGAVALLLATAACGSDKASTGGSDELAVGTFPGTLFTYPLSVAEKKGFFRDEELNVKLINGKSGPEILSGMIGGSTQIIFGQTGVIVPAKAQGQGMKVIGPYSRGRVVIVATEASGISSLKELPGKKFAVPQRGDTNEQRTLEVLKEFDIDGSKINFIGTGAPQTTAAALANGQADASVLGLTTYESLLAQGIKLRILGDSAAGTMGERGKNDITGVFASTTKYFDENPATVGKFCRGMKTTIDWIADDANLDEATTLMAKWTGLPEKAARKVVESENKIWSMALDQKLWDANVGYFDAKLDPEYDDTVINDCQSLK